MNNGRTLTIVGAAALLVGALMPWATITAPFVGTVNIPGYRGDGLITGALGFILLLGALAKHGKPGKFYSIIFGIVGLLTLLVTGPKVLSIGAIETAGAISGVGFGLWVSIIGGGLAGAGGFTKAPPAPVVPASMPEFHVAQIPARPNTELPAPPTGDPN